jgi:hypothetical protein
MKDSDRAYEQAKLREVLSEMRHLRQDMASLHALVGSLCGVMDTLQRSPIQPKAFTLPPHLQRPR